MFAKGLLRLVYNDYRTPFDELLKNNKFITETFTMWPLKCTR